MDLANRTILHRNPPSPLLCLNLCLTWCQAFDRNLLTIPYISSLLIKASSLDLRHLTFELGYNQFLPLLPLIFSSRCLESLTLDCLPIAGHICFPQVSVSLNHLKRLCIHSQRYCSNLLSHLIPQLNALEYLHVKSACQNIDLRSTTVRKFKLVTRQFYSTCNLIISMPSLEIFEFEPWLLSEYQWQWEMPKLRKAAFELNDVSEKNVELICNILNTIAYVEELHLDITESRDECHPFHALLVPGVKPPTLFSMKHINLQICFHEYNIEDLVTLVQHCPTLQSLKLIHKPPFHASKYKKKKLWRSKLPRNAEGNYRHAYFKDLHIKEKKEEFLKQILRKHSSKMLMNHKLCIAQ